MTMSLYWVDRLRVRDAPGPWRDLQTQWEPASFEWRLCQRPMPYPGALCHCIGYLTQEQADLKLCPCRFAAKYGIYDIRPVLPPVRSHHDPEKFKSWRPT